MQADAVLLMPVERDIIRVAVIAVEGSGE